MDAYNFSLSQKEYELHWQAFLNLAVQDTVGTGKHIRRKYTDFKSFYNPDRKAVSKENKRINKILEMQRKINNREGVNDARIL